jgi:L-threonylcarbamoyladenylate synthase
MSGELQYRHAAKILEAGGVIAYPTEGVYGLGCLPDDPEAVARLLDIKGRKVTAGFILIAPHEALLGEWIAPTATEYERLQSRWEYPVTWIVTAARATPEYLTGGRNTVAVRISDHPVVAGLCYAVGSALISTSANRSGRPAARHLLGVRKQLGRALDLVVPGALGRHEGPSEIRMAQDNRVIRPRRVPLSN